MYQAVPPPGYCAVGCVVVEAPATGPAPLPARGDLYCVHLAAVTDNHMAGLRSKGVVLGAGFALNLQVLPGEWMGT